MDGKITPYEREVIQTSYITVDYELQKFPDLQEFDREINTSLDNVRLLEERLQYIIEDEIDFQKLEKLTRTLETVVKTKKTLLEQKMAIINLAKQRLQEIENIDSTLLEAVLFHLRGR